MANPQFNCRLTAEVLTLINSEVERLTAETGKKVSQADVVSMAVARWCSGEVECAVIVPAALPVDDERPAAESMRTLIADVSAQPIKTGVVTGVSVPGARAESVAQRRAREAKEHAEALADSDVTAKLTGRSDIEYDLDNVTHRATAVQPRVVATERHHYEVADRQVKTLARPHGSVEAKRRRDQ